MAHMPALGLRSNALLCNLTPLEEIYVKYYTMPRDPNRQPRRDTGKTKSKKPPNDDDDADPMPMSEAAWTKRRRMSVDEAAAAAAEKDREGQRLEDKVNWDDHDNLTQKQKELVNKQRNKYDARKVQAYLDGALVDAEATSNVVEQAEEELSARKKRAKEREAKQKRVQASIKKAAFDVETVKGKKCFFNGNVDKPELRATLTQNQCTVVADRLAADFFIAQDPSSLGCRSTWAAVLKGLFVVSPAALQGKGRGAVLRYKPALSVRRIVYITPQFAEHHPEVTKILVDAGNDKAISRSQWKFAATLEDQPRPSCPPTERKINT